jgi:hypothetical protein
LQLLGQIPCSVDAVGAGPALEGLLPVKEEEPQAHVWENGLEKRAGKMLKVRVFTDQGHRIQSLTKSTFLLYLYLIYTTRADCSKITGV